MEIKERNCAGNTKHGLTLLEEAARQSDLVILPEIWTTGYSLGHLKEEAVSLDSPLVETLRGIAVKYQCSLLPGSLPVLKNGLVYNMIPAINKEGKIVHQYGKAHLFGMFEEEKFFLEIGNVISETFENVLYERREFQFILIQPVFQIFHVLDRRWIYESVRDIGRQISQKIFQ